MADKEDQQAPKQKDVTGEKTCDSQDGPKQWDYFPWDRWSRERSTDSRERSVDSRDSATRERDRRYAEELKRDCERGRREEVILYRHRDSETTQSDSTEEEDAESSNGSKAKAPTSTTVNESAENKRTCSKEAVPVPLGHNEWTEHALAKHTHQKAAKTSKSPPTSKEASKRMELAKEATEGSTFVANKRNGNADQKGSGDSHSKTSRNGNKGITNRTCVSWTFLPFLLLLPPHPLSRQLDDKHCRAWKATLYLSAGRRGAGSKVCST
ncbi:uncharacterized protein LOC142774218 [Rhipicephalus microplus]|uniref:uncharacterized protein LOC142774218 n=1 Tax=Rhipicephalus microplus TaxID=6941 RepID=UPI003F6BAE8D